VCLLIILFPLLSLSSFFSPFIFPFISLLLFLSFYFSPFIGVALHLGNEALVVGRSGVARVYWSGGHEGSLRIERQGSGNEFSSASRSNVEGKERERERESERGGGFSLHQWSTHVGSRSFSLVDALECSIIFRPLFYCAAPRPHYTPQCCLTKPFNFIPCKTVIYYTADI
jgi:hypothetical protein